MSIERTYEIARLIQLVYLFGDSDSSRKQRANADELGSSSRRRPNNAAIQIMAATLSFTRKAEVFRAILPARPRVSLNPPPWNVRAARGPMIAPVLIVRHFADRAANIGRPNWHVTSSRAASSSIFASSRPSVATSGRPYEARRSHQGLHQHPECQPQAAALGQVRR